MKFQQSDYCAKIGIKRPREEGVSSSTESLLELGSSAESDLNKRVKRGTITAPDFSVAVKVPLLSGVKA